MPLPQRVGKEKRRFSFCHYKTDFQNIVCWNQHKKFFLSITFEQNLRFWVTISTSFGSIDME